MKPRLNYVVVGALMLINGAIVFSRGADNGPAGPSNSWDDIIKQNEAQMVGQGRQIFRLDTFGDVRRRGQIDMRGHTKVFSAVFRTSAGCTDFAMRTTLAAADLRDAIFDAAERLLAQYG
jgi:hypothetical protein